MADTPGKLLSTLPSSSDSPDPRLSGCFLHLFDWNRRLHGKQPFPHKLLPPERQLASKTHKDDKRPMAKLLLIADENRGGFPRCTSEECGETFREDETLGRIPSKRTPGVVARLMGLETMPSPEPCCGRNDNGLDRNGMEAASVRYSERNALSAVVRASSFRGKSTRLEMESVQVYPAKELAKNSSSKDEEEALANRSGAMLPHIDRKFDDPKTIFFSRLPSLSPRQAESTFRSILSPSKSHNSLVSPIKSPLASKSAARLFEAAAKILEPSMQPSSRGGNAGMRSHVARPLLRDYKGEEKAGRSASPVLNKKSNLARSSRKGELLSRRVSEASADQKMRWPEKCISVGLPNTPADQASSSQEEALHQVKTQVRSKHYRRPGNAGDFRSQYKNQQDHGLSVHGGIRKGASQKPSQRSEIARKEISRISSEQLLARSKTVRGEKSLSKCSHGRGNLSSGREERLQPDLRKQVPTSRRLNLSDGKKNQSLKRLGAKLERGASSPLKRNAFDSDNHAIVSPKSSQASVSEGNDYQSSEKLFQGSTQSISSLVSSNSFSSFKDGEDDGGSKMEVTHRKGNSSLMRSLLRRATVNEVLSSSGKGSPQELKPIKPTRQSLKDETMIASENQSTLLAQIRRCAGELDESSMSSPSVKYEVQEVVETDTNDSYDMDSTSCAPSSVRFGTDFAENLAPFTEISTESNAIGTERIRARWKTVDSSSVMTSRLEVNSDESSHMAVAENSIRGRHQSSLCDEFRDTESEVHLDVGGSRRESVSYSGKTTAVILEELLMALSCSRAALNLERSEDKCDDSRLSGSDSCSEATMCREFERRGGSHSAISEHAGDNGCHAADFAAVMDSFLKENKGIAKDFQKFSNGGLLLEECESVSDSVCTEECGHSSPVSILESPFQDESSNSSDSFGSRQGTAESQIEDGDSAESGGIIELRDTKSRAHNIDISFDSKAIQVTESEEEYVKQIVGAAKLSPEDVYSARMQLSGPLIDPALFNELEEKVQQWDWRISSSIVCPEHEDADSVCRTEMEISFRNEQEEAGVHMRKLLFDCMNEALSSNLGVGGHPSGLCYHPLVHSSTKHLLGMVYRQVDEWRGMDCNMNVDELIEKEMNWASGRWSDFSNEVAEIAMEMEGHIIKSLIDEVVREMRCRECKIAHQRGDELQINWR